MYIYKFLDTLPHGGIILSNWSKIEEEADSECLYCTALFTRAGNTAQFSVWHVRRFKELFLMPLYNNGSWDVTTNYTYMDLICE